jgi:restriction system protein
MASSPRSNNLRRDLAAQQRAAEQAARQQARDQALAYEQGRKDQASQMTAAVEQRVGALTGILAASLASPPPGVNLDGLKKRPVTVPIELGADAQPMPAPRWQNFEPAPPGPVGRLFGGEARYAKDREAAERAFTSATESHHAAEIARQRRVSAARTAQAQRQTAVDADIARHNGKVNAFAMAVRDGDRHAVSRYFQMTIDQVPDPNGFPCKRLAGYVPESTLLALEWRLPTPDVVPAQKSFKWIKTRDEIAETARATTEMRTIYQTLVAQLALRALRSVFAADRFSLVSTVVFNGIVDVIDPTTGQPIEPCLITLRATREQFDPLVLDQLNPVACIRKYFAADVSRHPEELEPVPPVMEFKMADPRIIDPVDVISQIDKRPNLLELTSKEFEYFVHNLFDRMGFDTKLFRADGDGGVDCVAYDPTPIRGGKYVIQAKLYKKTVPPTAVRDLYGTMQHEGAQSGILITTSGFGPGSYQFANGKPLQLIDGSGLLALCQDYNIPARIVRVTGK